MKTPSSFSGAGYFARSSALLRELAFGAVGPLFERFRVGEGALLAIVASLVVSRAPALGDGLIACAICVLVMGAMYLHNDRVDAAIDLANPRKNHELARVLTRYDGLFASLHALARLVLPIALLKSSGPASAFWCFATMSLNVMYSRWFKRWPVIDVVVVSFWGATFAAIVERSLSPLVAVGLMAGISHVFQTLLDRQPDANAGIKTTAVTSQRLAVLSVVALSSFLALWAWVVLPAWCVPFAFVPIVSCWMRSHRAAWLISKVAFAVLWLASLVLR